MGEHTVASFDEDLGQISKLISDMGDLAGQAGQFAVVALDDVLAAAAHVDICLSGMRGTGGTRGRPGRISRSGR